MLSDPSDSKMLSFTHLDPGNVLDLVDTNKNYHIAGGHCSFKTPILTILSVILFLQYKTIFSNLYWPLFHKFTDVNMRMRILLLALDRTRRTGN